MLASSFLFGKFVVRVLVLAWFFYFAHSVQNVHVQCFISVFGYLFKTSTFVTCMFYNAAKILCTQVNTFWWHYGPIVISSISNYCSVFIVQLSTSFVSFINDFSNRSVLSHNWVSVFWLYAQMCICSSIKSCLANSQNGSCDYFPTVESMNQRVVCSHLLGVLVFRVGWFGGEEKWRMNAHIKVDPLSSSFNPTWWRERKVIILEVNLKYKQYLGFIHFNK